jgi:hypothetical protein
MPILAGLLVSIFSALVQFLVTYVSKKLAIGLAALGIFAGLTVALWAGIGLALAGVAATFSYDSGFSIGLWVAVSHNGQAVAAATVAADTAIALYKWNVENLRLLAYVT